MHHLWRWPKRAMTMTEAEILKSLRNLKRIARFMDAGWGIPYTRFRFGADSLIGLVPGGGDLATMLVSLYLVVKAHEMGAPKNLLLRMLGNVAIDTGIGSVPILGDIFDAMFMSNVKNMQLLTEFIKQKGIRVD
jgi:Domain of unknown function (DUF4112)